jgi:hypothetical protein
VDEAALTEAIIWLAKHVVGKILSTSRKRGRLQLLVWERPACATAKGIGQAEKECQSRAQATRLS